MKTRFALSRSGLPAFVLVLLATLLTVCVTPGAASAQSTDPKAVHQPLNPPTPTTPDDPPIVWNILAIGVVFLATLGAALIPSKRGHQD